MPAFSETRMSRLQDGLNNLKRRMTSTLYLTLSDEEFISAFVHADHLDALKTATEIVGQAGGSSFTFQATGPQGTSLIAYCQFSGEPPIIIPRYASGGVAGTCPPDLRQKINDWLAERERLGLILAYSNTALHEVCRMCHDTGAATVLFPALPVIARAAAYSDSADDSMTKLSQKLATAKSFGSIPRMDASYRRRLTEASDLILAASVMSPEDSVTVPHRHALITISGADRAFA